ncbi:hypothetical protein IQ06DRAFT_365526 [Phaeosphaeriaceae sp. SRC1lsM3a]|nr:hypothetical protein IQ06DRAFT_365526 [Stagonospora sp. SRC1lsM3a]
MASPTSPSSYRSTSSVIDLNTLFHQANAAQDLLRFEHDSKDIEPAISVIQEYARAIRLQFIRTRWSRIGLTEWHSEIQILLSARASMYMGLNVWDPLDDFLDTYVFEMEIQPQCELDARGRKVVKRGLLKQLQESAAREQENCHKALCDILEGKLSNWRVLDSKLLTFKKKVWLDCEERGSLTLTPTDQAVPSTSKQVIPSPTLAALPAHQVNSSPTAATFPTSSAASSMAGYTPPPSEYSTSMPMENVRSYAHSPTNHPVHTWTPGPFAYYQPPSSAASDTSSSWSAETMAQYPPAPASESSSSWTTDSVACYTPPPPSYQLMYQPYIC